MKHAPPSKQQTPGLHHRTNVNAAHDEGLTIGQRIADAIASFVGSWLCIDLHALWFALWFLLRLDINLLTLIVSLEAIFLCTLLMMSQNRQATKDRIAAEVDYAVNRKAEEHTEAILSHLDEQDHLILQIVQRLEAEK